MSTEDPTDIIPLDEFVEATLVQIVTGVISAQRIVSQFKACINPVGLTFAQSGIVGRGFTSDGNICQLVDFDVTVTAGGTRSKKAAAAIIGVLGLGLSAQNEKNATATNKLRFSIPLLLPGTSLEIEEKTSGAAAFTVHGGQA